MQNELENFGGEYFYKYNFTFQNTNYIGRVNMYIHTSGFGKSRATTTTFLMNINFRKLCIKIPSNILTEP